MKQEIDFGRGVFSESFGPCLRWQEVNLIILTRSDHHSPFWTGTSPCSIPKHQSPILFMGVILSSLTGSQPHHLDEVRSPRFFWTGSHLLEEEKSPSSEKNPFPYITQAYWPIQMNQRFYKEKFTIEFDSIFQSSLCYIQNNSNKIRQKEFLVQFRLLSNGISWKVSQVRLSTFKL